MLTDKTLYEFACTCAKIYCKKFNVFDQYDDACSESCIYLLQHKEKWNIARNKLQTRVVFELQRKYQQEYGLRRKTKIKYVEDVEILINDKSKEVLNISERYKTRLDIVKKALKQPDIYVYADILSELVEGVYTRKEIAKRHNISVSRLSQVFRLFKITCLRLNENQHPTSQEDFTNYPLLYM